MDGVVGHCVLALVCPSGPRTYPIFVDNRSEYKDITAKVLIREIPEYFKLRQAGCCCHKLLELDCEAKGTSCNISHKLLLQYPLSGFHITNTYRFENCRKLSEALLNYSSNPMLELITFVSDKDIRDISHHFQ